MTVTDRQIQILVFLHDFTTANGFPPTLREIARRFDIRSTNGVNDHLRALENKRLITRHPHLSRTIRVTEAGYGVLGDQSAKRAE